MPLHKLCGLRSPPLSGTCTNLFRPGRIAFQKNYNTCSLLLIRELTQRFQLIFPSSYSLIFSIVRSLWYSPRLTFFMLPVLPHPLTAGSAHPFSLPASLGSCASSINAKLDSWSRHRSATSLIATPFPGPPSLKIPEDQKLILRSSTMAQHPMYGVPAASPVVYHQRYFFVTILSIAESCYLAFIDGFHTHYGC